MKEKRKSHDRVDKKKDFLHVRERYHARVGHI